MAERWRDWWNASWLIGVPPFIGDSKTEVEDALEMELVEVDSRQGCFKMIMATAMRYGFPSPIFGVVQACARVVTSQLGVSHRTWQKRLNCADCLVERRQ